MYSMTPYLEFSSEILLPTCMYRLQAISDVKVLQEDAAAVAFSGEVDPLEELLEKQNVLLKKLKSLQDDVTAELVQQATNAVEKSIKEIVISIDPSNPSPSIILAQSILSSTHPILISCFTHSSAGFVDRLKLRIHPSPNSYDRNEFKFGITYILKRFPHLPTLLLDPIHQIPIRGESNIIKFLFTLITGHDVTTGNHGDDLAMATIVDDLIDAIDSFITNGSPTLDSILDTLEQTLSSSSSPPSSPWLFGGKEVGAVDVVLWSALKSSNKSAKTLPKKVKLWFEHCAKKFEHL